MDMGYLIARSMRTYGMNLHDVMSMPIRAFWTLSGFVERLHADEAKLKLEISSTSQNQEAAKELYEALERQAPHPLVFTGHAMVVSAKRDEGGIARLAALAG